MSETDSDVITFRLDHAVDGTPLPRPDKYDYETKAYLKETCFMVVEKGGYSCGPPNGDNDCFINFHTFTEGMIVCEDYKYNCMNEIDFPASILVKNDNVNLARASKILDLLRQKCTARAYNLRESPWILLRFGPTPAVAAAMLVEREAKNQQLAKKRKFVQDMKTAIDVNQWGNSDALLLTPLPKRFRTEYKDMVLKFVTDAIDQMTDIELTDYKAEKTFPISIGKHAWSGVHTFGIWWENEVCVGLHNEERAFVMPSIESRLDFTKAQFHFPITWEWCSKTGFKGIEDKLDQQAQISRQVDSLHHHMCFAQFSLMSVHRVIEEIQTVKLYV